MLLPLSVTLSLTDSLPGDTKVLKSKKIGCFLFDTITMPFVRVACFYNKGNKYENKENCVENIMRQKLLVLKKLFCSHNVFESHLDLGQGMLTHE